MAQLKNGDLFPRLEAPSVDHGVLRLPDALPEGNYGIVLGYRAHW